VPSNIQESSSYIISHPIHLGQKEKNIRFHLWGNFFHLLTFLFSIFVGFGKD
jgi:hypothetical protein